MANNNTSKGGWVYLISENGDNAMFKIGVTKSKSVEDRIKKLQTGNGNELIKVCEFYSNNPFKLESMLHNKYALNREEGEWFLMTEDEVNEFPNICKLYQHNIDVLKDNPFF